MHIFERRRRRLSELLLTMTAVDLHKLSGVAASSISAFHKQLPDGRYLRNIGEVTARKLESGTGKPEGWMDAIAPADGHNDHLAPEVGNGAREKITQFPVSHTLESTIERLVGYLKCVPEHRRKAVGGILESLALHPDDHLGCVVSLKSLLSSNEGRADETATGTNNAPR